MARKSIDVQRLAEALKMKGIDPRSWTKSATVGLWTEGGEFVTDKRAIDAIYVDPRGAVVDIRIEPDGTFETARYDGIAVGQFGAMLVPLKQGDEVVVGFPDGESSDLAILAIRSNEVARIPADWNNDRVLFDLRVPFEIRGPIVKITSPLLTLNGRLVVASAEPV